MERQPTSLRAALIEDVARSSLEPAPLVAALIRVVPTELGVRIIDACEDTWSSEAIAKLTQGAWWRKKEGAPPLALAERMVSAARGLTEIEDRVPSLCVLARWAREDERREALDRIKDSSFPLTDERTPKPVWRGAFLKALLEASPDAWKEEWIAHHVAHASSGPATAEAIERHMIGHWPEAALRRLWSGMWTGPRPPRGDLLFLIPHLPTDLRDQTLERLRRNRSDKDVRHLFCRFGAGLTDDEVDDLVRTPWIGAAHRANEQDIARHLWTMHEYGHLRRARRERVDAWFDWALSCRVDYWRDRALEALLPYLTPPQLRQAVAAILAKGMTGISDTDETFAGRLTAEEIDTLARVEPVITLPWGPSYRDPWPGLLAAARRSSRDLWERCLERFTQRAMKRRESERLRLAAVLLEDLEIQSPGFAETLAQSLLARARSRG